MKLLPVGTQQTLGNLKHQDRTLPDPNRTMSLNEVKKHYVAMYPELVNSILEGPSIKEGNAVYKFASKVGAHA